MFRRAACDLGWMKSALELRLQETGSAESPDPETNDISLGQAFAVKFDNVVAWAAKTRPGRRAPFSDLWDRGLARSRPCRRLLWVESGGRLPGRNQTLAVMAHG